MSGARFAADRDRRVQLFGNDPIPVIFQLASLEELRTGDIVMRGKLPTYPLDKQTLPLIEGRWSVCSKDKIGTAEAFELVPRGESGCSAR